MIVTTTKTLYIALDLYSEKKLNGWNCKAAISQTSSSFSSRNSQIFLQKRLLSEIKYGFKLYSETTRAETSYFESVNGFMLASPIDGHDVMKFLVVNALMHDRNPSDPV